MTHYYSKEVHDQLPKSKREQYEKNGEKGTICISVGQTTTNKEEVTCTACRFKIKTIRTAGSVRFDESTFNRLQKAKELHDVDSSKTIKSALRRYLDTKNELSNKLHELRKTEELRKKNKEKKLEKLSYKVPYRCREILLDNIKDDFELRFAIKYHLDICGV